jgi:hypothetical protein
MQETVIPIINPLSFLTRPSLMHSLIVLIQKNLLSHPSENDKGWKNVQIPSGSSPKCIGEYYLPTISKDLSSVSHNTNDYTSNTTQHIKDFIVVNHC